MFEQIRVSSEIYGNGRGLLLVGDASVPNDLLAAYKGKVQVVYIDPPFMTGDKFVYKRPFGEKGWRSGSPAIEYPAFVDRYESREEYLQMLRGFIQNAHDLLAPTGMFCLHLDWRTVAHGRLLCDEIFGEDRFVNEIIWAYESGGRAKKFFSRKHDNILLYSKSKDFRFDISTVPLERTVVRRNHLKRGVDADGREYRSVRVGGKEYRYYDDDPVYPGDVWTDISILQQRDPERTGYATQKPLGLMERLLKPLVKPGDIVADLCCGSGTTLRMAESLQCSVIGVDKNPDAVHITLRRLQDPDLVLHYPEEAEEATLTGSWSPIESLVLIDSFNAENPLFPKPQFGLDKLERWGIGRMKNNAMVVEQTFARSRTMPNLPNMGMVEKSNDPLLITTVDAAGKRRVFQWLEDQQQLTIKNLQLGFDDIGGMLL